MYKSSKNINNEAQNKAQLLSLSLSLSEKLRFLKENLNKNRFDLAHFINKILGKAGDLYV